MRTRVVNDYGLVADLPRGSGRIAQDRRVVDRLLSLVRRWARAGRRRRGRLFLGGDSIVVVCWLGPRRGCVDLLEVEGSNASLDASFRHGRRNSAILLWGIRD